MSPLPPLGFFAHGAAITGDYQAIMTATVDSGGASSITFSSIPSTYKHLQIRWIARQTPSNGYGDATLKVLVNSDTSTSSYTKHYLGGNGSSAYAGGGGTGDAFGNWGETAVEGNTANTFAAGVMDILDYSSTTKNKTIRHLQGYDYNGSGKVELFSGAWLNSSTAINSLTFNPGQTSFMQYSQFALCGIKG